RPGRGRNELVQRRRGALAEDPLSGTTLAKGGSMLSRARRNAAVYAMGLALLAAGVGGDQALRAQSPAADEPSWQWPEPRWREVVGKVRAGRSLLPPSWPAGAKVAVALSFDFDNETPALRDNQSSPGVLSQGEYGARAGLPRILALLER